MLNRSLACSIQADGSGVSVVSGAARSHHVAGRQATWSGFLYDSQGRTQTRAVDHLLEELAAGRPLIQVAATLRGAFFLAVHDQASDTTWCCIDDSGLYSAYCTDRVVSSSFLDLCRREGIGSADFSPSAMIEFLQLGNVYFGETLTPRVRRLSADELIEVGPAGVTRHDKGIGTLATRPAVDDWMIATAALAEALRGEQVSVDLTGGFDSRMLACLLHAHGVPFEAALSGRETSEDACLGRAVAEALGVDYHFTVYDPSKLLDQLPATLQRLDGLGGLILLNHRLIQLGQDRAARGATVSLKGSGGELYKDFFWTQDFPFYRSRKTRIDRLHRLRIEFELLQPNYLTAAAYRTFQQRRAYRRQELQRRYAATYNTQSYDNVYFYERVQTWNSRAITSSQLADLAVHAPLCELTLARIGYHAPRRQRFFNRLHRQVITAAAPAAARIKTTDRTSASAGRIDMLRDLAGYVQAKSRKAAKKLSQLVANRTHFESSDYAPDTELIARIAGSEIGRDSFEQLKAHDLLQTSATFDDLSPRFRQHAIVLGWTLARLS